MRHKKTYHDMETSRADMTRETPAEYVARKFGIRGDADGDN